MQFQLPFHFLNIKCLSSRCVLWINLTCSNLIWSIKLKYCTPKIIKTTKFFCGSNIIILCTYTIYDWSVVDCIEIMHQCLMTSKKCDMTFRSRLHKKNLSIKNKSHSNSSCKKANDALWIIFKSKHHGATESQQNHLIEMMAWVCLWAIYHCWTLFPKTLLSDKIACKTHNTLLFLRSFA